MQYMTGEVDLLSYLLAPHGAHPHAVVYGLYLVDWRFGGQQLVPFAVSVVCIASFGILSSALVYTAARKRGAAARSSSLAGAAALVVGVAVSREILEPFQVVLTASRLIYCLGLLGFVFALRGNRTRMDLVLLAATSLAVTFHGSGLLFAILIALQHMILSKTMWQRAAGLLPLITFLIYTFFWLPPGQGELSGLGSWLATITIDSIWRVALGAFAYYGSIFFILLPNKSEYWVLLIIGAPVALASGLWALRIIIEHKKHDVSALTLAFFSLFAALSAGSAGLIWEIRATLDSAIDPLHNVVISQRYAASAALGFLVLCVPLASRHRSPLSHRAGLSLTAALALAFAFTSQRMIEHRGGMTTAMDIAATAVFAGARFTETPAEELWPRVAEDWYWPNQLTVLSKYMQQKRVGFYRYLPEPGTNLSGNSWQVRLLGAVTEPTSAAGICAIQGSFTARPGSKLTRGHLFPVVDAQGIVQGAIAVHESDFKKVNPVSGHVRCGVEPTQMSIVTLLN